MSDSTIRYEPCVVSFIDVLGFRNLLATRSANDIHGLLKQLEQFTRPDEEDSPTFFDWARCAHTAAPLPSLCPTR